MSKLLNLWLLLASLITTCYAQNADTLYRFTADDRGWEVDELGNYYVYDYYETRKYDRSMQLIATFSSREFGVISSIDVSDPLKPLIFYSMFSKVVELDNSFALSLSWTPQLDGVGQSLIGCRSTGGAYWFFNQLGLQPVLVDQTSKVVSTGISLKTLSDGEFTISDIECKGPWMVLIDKTFGFYVYDQYGTFAYKVPAPGGMFSGLTNTDLYYFKGELLVRRNLRTGQETQFKMGVMSGATSFKVQMGTGFAQVGNALIKIDL